MKPSVRDYFYSFCFGVVVGIGIGLTITGAILLVDFLIRMGW